MIGAYIRETSTKPFVWGENDCALWCANGILQATGVDPARGFRGTYSSWFECRRLIFQAGGLVPLIAPHMPEGVFSDLEGDGAAIMRIGKQNLCGFIRSGRAVVRTRQAVSAVDDFEILKGWSWSR